MVLVKPQVTLLVKNGLHDNRTLASVGLVQGVENNLSDWLVRCSITNTGYSKTNNGTLTLRIDQFGTFIRSGPILVDQNTKNNYLIELQLKQDLNNDGDVTDGNESGKILRAIIGQPQISIDQSFGEILTINLIGIEYRLKEIPTSSAHLFRDPNTSFTDRLTEVDYSTNGIFIDSGVNALPQTPKLNWIPQSPTTVHDTITDIIDTLSLPQTLGGAFQDYYFDFSPDATKTNYVDYIAEEFGKTSSGVVIDPLSIEAIDSDQEQTIVTDNIEYKNHVILIGSSTGGSVPNQRALFASEFLHAELRDNWATGVNYIAGDLVKYEKTTTTYSDSPSILTYHRAKINHTSSSGNNPFTGAGTQWEQDFTTVPVFKANAYYNRGEVVTSVVSGNRKFYQAKNSGTFGTTPSSDATNWSEQGSVPDTSYTNFFSYTHWTTDENIWKETLAGHTFALGQGYHGFAYDWNITRQNYKRKNLTNHYEPVSVKWVTSVGLNTPPSNPYLFDGNRYIVGTSPTGAWAGNAKKVAEWDSNKLPTAGWQFSASPVENDTINDLETGYIWTYTGGNWIPSWEWDNPATNDRPSPFHACKNVGLVAGATQIPAQAVEFLYDWQVGNEINRTARGAWINLSFPFPRLNTSNEGTGGRYGGSGNGSDSPRLGTLNTDNMDYSNNGNIGWNLGVESEDMGKITAIKFKMRCSIYKDANTLSDGVPNIPMTFWCVDKFDRVWFSKFKLKRNGQWDTVTIPIGSLSPQQLYYARWDELARLNDVVLTPFSFTLQEREFTGVQFDWRFVKHMGWFMDEAYTDVGLYKNGLERALDYGANIAGQLASNPYWLFGPIISGLVNYFDPPIKADVLKSFVKIAIDDLHFVKELIVNSSEVTLSDPRTSIEFMSTETDYKNLKQRAIGMASRKSFFPQMWHIRAVGDVRLQYGKTFTITGSRVPSGSQTMVISEVKHIFDHDGYHVELLGVRKFATSG